jgi:hypothetical protein
LNQPSSYVRELAQMWSSRARVFADLGDTQSSDDDNSNLSNNTTTEVEIPTNTTTEVEIPTNTTTEEEIPTNTTTEEEIPTDTTTPELQYPNLRWEEEIPTDTTTEVEIPTNTTTEEEIPTMKFLFKIGGVVFAILDNITDWLFYDHIVSSNALEGIKGKDNIEKWLFNSAMFGSFILFCIYMYSDIPLFKSLFGPLCTISLHRSHIDSIDAFASILVSFEDFPQMILILIICRYIGFDIYSMISFIFSYIGMTYKLCEYYHNCNCLDSNEIFALSRVMTLNTLILIPIGLGFTGFRSNLESMSLTSIYKGYYRLSYIRIHYEYHMWKEIIRTPIALYEADEVDEADVEDEAVGCVKSAIIFRNLIYIEGSPIRLFLGPISILFIPFISILFILIYFF